MSPRAEDMMMANTEPVATNESSSLPLRRAGWGRAVALGVVVLAVACGDDGNIVLPDGGGSDGSGGGPDACASCEDADMDTVCDRDEGSADIDGDMLPNSEDPDSDGDGVPDRQEAGDADPCTPPRDSDGDGLPDFLDPAHPPRDAGVPDGGGDGGMVDMGPPPGCNPNVFVESDCLPNDVVEGDADLCDGLDNDCDGRADENCSCTPGDVQECFLGPPSRRAVGACRMGTQVCVGAGGAAEFGEWGPCVGLVAPREETCDALDNDCNGCVDDGAHLEGCVPEGSCPAPGDERIPDGAPFATYPLDGADFIEPEKLDSVVSWQWEVVGTPCDRMFQSLPGSPATSTNGQLSYTLNNAESQMASIDFTLSGDYEVTLSAEMEDGETFSCTWIVPVRAPGLRVELCWDETGPAVSSTLDIDLHLGKQGTTPRFFTPQDCYFATCKGSGSGADWGYEDTDIANCTGPGARGNFSGSCPNPRLDIDNISFRDEFVPENINVDNPDNEDRFRVMVHHWSSSDRATHPLVNVYCGGRLRGSYGQAPSQIQSFDEGGGSCGGDMWRVVDVLMEVDEDTGVTTGCRLRPVRQPGGPAGEPYITTDDCSY